MTRCQTLELESTRRRTRGQESMLRQTQRRKGAPRMQERTMLPRTREWTTLPRTWVRESKQPRLHQMIKINCVLFLVQ